MQGVRIVTAEERLSAANNKTSLAIFGPPGSGKTSLLKTLPADKTVCLDLEAGMKSVQDWPGASVPVRSFADFRDLAVLIGGADPAANANVYYSERHLQHVRGVYAGSGLEEFLATRPIVFVDSITDLTRQAMAFAKQQPEAVSERTGRPDVRGAYGLLGREVIQALKHLQHAPGRTVIFVGVLEKVTDELNAATWQPQMEAPRPDASCPESSIRWSQCTCSAATPPVTTSSMRRPANAVSSAAPATPSAPGQGPLGPPRGDRAAEPRRAARQDQQDDRGGFVCDAVRPGRPCPLRLIAIKRRSETMYDLNDAQPQMLPVGDPIPDGTFAKIRMTIRPGGVDGSVPMDRGLLKASATSDAKMLDCELTVLEGPFAKRKFWQNFTVAGGKVDDKGGSKGWNISKGTFRAMIDSALGLDWNDKSDVARQKRLIQGLKQLDGIAFAGRIMIEPASSPQYKDANKLANVVLPGDPQYAAIMRGDPVAPEPVNAKPRKPAETPVALAPAWGAPTPAAAPATVPWAEPSAPAAAKPAGPDWLNT